MTTRAKLGRTNYRERFERLAEQARQMGYRVVFVKPRVLHDYAGMNPEAARVMGYPMPANEIRIEEGMGWRGSYETLRHELREMGLMKGGMKYYPAHVMALRYEHEGE